MLHTDAPDLSRFLEMPAATDVLVIRTQDGTHACGDWSDVAAIIAPRIVSNKLSVFRGALLVKRAQTRVFTDARWITNDTVIVMSHWLKGAAKMVWFYRLTDDIWCELKDSDAIQRWVQAQDTLMVLGAM